MQVQRLVQCQEVSQAEHKQQLIELRDSVSSAFDRFSKRQTTIAELVSELGALGVHVSAPEEGHEPETPKLDAPEAGTQQEAEASQPEPR